VDRKISPNRNFLKEPDFSILKNLFSHLKVKISPSDCFQIGYKVYHKGNLNLKDFLDYLPVLKPVYMGVWLGNEKTKRIEPAHAFALSFRKEEMDKIPSVELKEPLIIDYLRGHEIPYNSDFKDGFRVVTHEGFPVGWANYKQKRLKNFFPKGMRNKL
jgi:NOL1/NOP2/fmu family ribosome biogenesis protein